MANAPRCRAQGNKFRIPLGSAHSPGSKQPPQSALMAAKLARLRYDNIGARSTTTDKRLTLLIPVDAISDDLRTGISEGRRMHLILGARDKQPRSATNGGSCTVRLSNIATRIGTGACQDLHYGGVTFDP